MEPTNNLEKIISYINQHAAAVLGTINENNEPHGAVIFVYANNDGKIYFLTKNQTQKYNNLISHPQVSLTIFDQSNNSTLQASGQAHQIDDPEVNNQVMPHITRAQMGSPEWLPPIAKIQAGDYKLFCITPSRMRLAEFAGKEMGDNKAIFTEV